MLFTIRNMHLKMRSGKIAWAKGENADMGQIHKFRNEPLDDYGMREKIYVDDKAILCSGYTITHNVDELPLVTINVVTIPKYENNVVVMVENKEEIARLMDKSEFDEFCKIWEEVHNE